MAGLLLAGLAALVVSFAALIVEGMLQDQETTRAVVQTVTLAAAMTGLDPSGLAIASALHLVWLGALVVGWGPVGLAALVAWSAGMRSRTGIAAMSGLLAAALPLLVVAFAGSTPAPQLLTRLVAVLFFSGSCSGLVYASLAITRDR